MPTNFNLDVARIEDTLHHHQPIPTGGGGVLCACADTFGGSSYHRRHVASLIAAGEMCEPSCAHPAHGTLLPGRTP